MGGECVDMGAVVGGEGVEMKSVTVGSCGGEV